MRAKGSDAERSGGDGGDDAPQANATCQSAASVLLQGAAGGHAAVSLDSAQRSDAAAEPIQDWGGSGCTVALMSCAACMETAESLEAYARRSFATRGELEQTEPKPRQEQNRHKWIGCTR